jgi:predicted kinase
VSEPAPALELAVLVGLQGSGKSAFAAARLPGHAHVSKDLMRSARDKRARQRRLIDEALSAGKSVVVDNTNPTREDRAPLIAQARAHGARAVCYWFDEAPRDCLSRNAARDGRARVPAAAIWATARRLQVPDRLEGFDHLLRVRLGAGGFEIVSVD